MRYLKHPGPVAAEREQSARCRATPLSLRLEKGLSANSAITGALARAGFSAGYVHLENVAISPMRYVIPAASPDDSHVAWYSETFAPEGIVTIERAGVIAGTRDGAPFIHCHGIWVDEAGNRRAGHLLPHEAFIVEDATVRAWGIKGANYIARDDAETNFKLFAAEATGQEVAAPNALAATIRPNADISVAIEAVCRRHGITQARILGVGSLNEVDFDDGRRVASYATEVFIDDGHIFTTDGRLQSQLDVSLVDLRGAIHSGRLMHGRNPVCVTFELLIVAND
jgi:predicted DNA-binding protein with PD1-like motif